MRDLDPLHANKRHLEILQLAAQAGEALGDAAVRCVLEQGEIGEGKLNVNAIRRALLDEAPVTEVAVAEVALASCDELLGGSRRG